MPRALSRSLLCSMLLTVSLPWTAAQQAEPEPESTPPWRLSWDERMALRSTLPLQEPDPELRPSGLPMPQKPVLDIDGATDPGALVPWEIFAAFLGRVYTSDGGDPTELREAILAGSLDPQLDRRDFWSRLEGAVAPYLALDERAARLLDEAAAAPEAAKAAIYAQLPSEEDYCQLRVVALDAARRQFGYETFDRFLYEAVAPTTRMGSVLTPAETRHVANGCPDDDAQAQQEP